MLFITREYSFKMTDKLVRWRKKEEEKEEEKDAYFKKF